MLVFPYTKRLNAVIATDQAASLVMMSAGTARALGAPSGPPGTVVAGERSTASSW